MADGKVVIAVDADAKQAQKELDKLTAKIDKMEADLKKNTGEQSGVKAQLDAAKESAKQTENAIKSLRAEARKIQNVMSGEVASTPEEFAAAYSRQSVVATQLKEQEASLREQDKIVESLDNKYARITDKVNEQSAALDSAKEKAGALAEEITEAGGASARMDAAVKKVSDSMNKFSNRVAGLFKRVLVFSLITRALQSLRTWLGKVIMQNEEARASFAQLKGALLTLAQPILQVVIPAFVTLMNILTRIITLLARIVSKVFGTTYEKSAAAAKALHDEQNALEGVGGAAKKAGKQLAAFDEINQLSNESDAGGGGAGGAASDSIAPDFSASIKDQLTAINEFLLGAGLLAVGAILTFSGANIPLGLALMVAGALMIYDAATENWDAISEALQGPIGKIVAIISGALLVLGAVLAFSGASIPLGIALMVLGAAGLATVAAVNWDTISEALQGPVGKIVAIVSAALLVLGAVLTFSGAALPLGIGLMVAGAAGLATTAALNWDLIVEKLQGPLGKILAIAGASLLVLGLILCFSGVGVPLGIGLMIAGGASLAAAIAPNWDFILDKLKGTWGKIKNFWNSNIAPIFTAEWWKNLAKNAFNGFLSGVESLINSVISGINWLISKLNAFKIDLPDWIPVIGGKSFGFSIPSIAEVQLPRLASGAVIPPNREFMAVLGDQRSGNNIEAPESLIRKIVREETGGSSRLEALLQTLIEVTREGKVIQVNERELGRVTSRAQANAMRGSGKAVLGY